MSSSDLQPDTPSPDDTLSPQASDAEKYRGRVQAARFSAIGIQFGVSIAVAALLGSWLDERWGTEPWLLLIGLSLGITSSFLELYRLARRQIDKS